MLQYAKNKYLNITIDFLGADADALLLANNSCHAIFSNLMLQWSCDYQNTLTEIMRILAKKGKFYFSTFGYHTLKELNHAWQQVDNKPHVHHFIQQHELQTILSELPIHAFQLQSQTIIRHYPSVKALMQELKMLGASNLHNDRNQGLSTKSKLQQMEMAYEIFRNAQQLLPASYEIFYGVIQK